jgi:hypothetical protein
MTPKLLEMTLKMLITDKKRKRARTRSRAVKKIDYR